MSKPASKKEGVTIAKELRKKLEASGYPIQSIVLFGSVAQEKSKEWSDIDIAVICKPFLPSKHEERRIFSREARKMDARSEVVCLHPNDLQNKYFTLAKEVQKYGITV